jgi:hypothetical protein
MVSFDEGAAASLDAPGFVAEEPELTDGIFEVGDGRGGVVGGGWILSKQGRSDPIHQFVRALGGEDGGDEQFEGIGKVEFAVGDGISALQCLEHKIQAFTFS